jgi:chromosome partitioning protein
MPLVIAFISQKGGVGKSTLARGLATYAIQKGINAKIADLDLQQKSVVVWETTRQRHELSPPIGVDSASDVAEAMRTATAHDLLILDTAGKITDGTSEAAQHANLLVQPTSPSSDDMHISVLVFLAMERLGVPREKLVYALTRVLSEAEEKYPRSYLQSFGYTVLEGFIPEHLGYREAMRSGRSICETGQKTLDASAATLMSGILQLAGQIPARRKRARQDK